MQLSAAKARWKTNLFFIITTEPITINSVSNSTNKLHFHSQKVNCPSKIEKLSESLKSILVKLLIKKI